MDSSTEPLVTDDGITSRRQIEVWLREARAGSTSALGCALQSCRKYLLAIANREIDDVLRSKAGASDLVQDTFTEAQQGFGRFRGATEEEFCAWLNAILDHRLANHARRYRGAKKREAGRELSFEVVEAVLANLRDPSATPGTRAIADDDSRRLREAMANLPAESCAVIVARTWERKSFAEVGLELGCSADAARMRWTRAVRELLDEFRRIH